MSQDENKVANHIGRLAYHYIVYSLSAGLHYGRLQVQPVTIHLSTFHQASLSLYVVHPFMSYG